MDDDFSADFMSNLGLDEEEVKHQQEMQRAKNEDLRNSINNYYILGSGNLDSPEGRADVRMFMQGKGEEEFANRATDFAKDTVENAFQGTVKAGHAMDDFLRTTPVLGPAYSLYADGVNKVTGADGAEDPYIEPLQQMTLAVDEWYRELERNDSANDKMAQEFFQYVIPFTTYLKGLQAAGGGAAAMTGVQQGAAAVGADVMTSWTALEPHFARLSQFLTEFETVKGTPMIGPVMEYLASTDGTDAEERLKNIGDSLLAAGLGAGVVGGLAGALKLSRTMWGNRHLIGDVKTPGTRASQEGAIKLGDEGANIKIWETADGQFSRQGKWIEGKNAEGVTVRYTDKEFAEAYPTAKPSEAADDGLWLPPAPGAAKQADVHPDSLLPERQLSDRIDAGEQVTARDYFTREPEGELEQAIFQAIDDAATGKSLVKKRGKEVPIGAPRGSTAFQQAVAKIEAGMYDGVKYTKKAIKERAAAMVEDGTILRPEKQMADEIIFNVTKDLEAGSAQRSAVQSVAYPDGAPVPRKRDVGEPKFRGPGSMQEATEATIAGLNKATPAQQKQALAASRKLLAEEYETKKLLTKNKKLLKTEQGKKKAEGQGEVGKPLKVTWIDGSEQKVETTGLSLMQDYREGKVAVCANSASCKDNCLGYFTGGNFQYGGGNNTQRLEATRRSHFMNTQAMLRDPEAFITVLDAEVKAAAAKAMKEGNKLGVRLNTLSDIPPPVYEALIRNNPDVMFYDYTKLGSRRLTNADGTPLANHHLTYSSTGINNPNQNWNQMVKVMDRGENITMVFTTKEGADLPKFVLDEKTGKKYAVVDGDTHDYRPADATPDGVDGVVVGLRNKDARNKGKSSAEQVEESGGFAVAHDGEDVVNIPEQFSPKRPKGQEGSADVGTLAGVALPSTWFLMQYPHLEDYEPELYAAAVSN